MNRLLLAIPVLLLAAAPVSAASSAEVKKACVAASTAGQTARDEGKLQDAKKQLLACTQDECPSIVRKSCEQWLADVNERIPSAIIRVLDGSGSDVTDLEVSVDGQAITLDGRPLTLEPGQHVAELKAADGSKTEHKFLLAEREQSRIINIQLSRPEVAGAGQAVSTPTQHGASNGFSPPSGAWVLGGVGVLGLASFTVFGLSAKKNLSDLQSSCSPNCTSDQTKAGRRDAAIADVSLLVGGAALISAVAWSLLSPAHPDKESASLSVVPMQNGVFATLSRKY